MSERGGLDPAKASKSAEMEQRRHIRFSCKLRAARTGDRTETFTPAHLARIMNISLSGIALHAGERFEVGAVLTIQLYASLTQSVSPPMEIRVVHNTQQPHGTWVLGAEFTKPLSEAELLRYLT